MAGQLELKGVVAGYDGGNVLRGIDLTVPPASITCIIGPNGAGKSTVLRTINGLLAPRSGSITLDGAPIGGRDPADVLAAGVVQVPQQDGLFPSLSVHENILMGGYVLRRNRKLVQERYQQVMEVLPDVREWAGRRAGNLSGGQRRQVEFARSLMLQPNVMLLDEPSMGLDPVSLKRVYELVALLRERNITVLLVEQNVRVGLSVASDVVVMESGQIRLHGRPEEILDSPEIANLYLGGGIDAQAEPGHVQAAAADPAHPTEQR